MKIKSDNLCHNSTQTVLTILSITLSFGGCSLKIFNPMVMQPHIKYFPPK